ncbi:MAG: pyrroline-5-carboxylate reductase [Candidatus Omnitrophica bacterium]|nr:pyrroline-5-carboxylate reductase [Candidatus Omnitrophota bacterium]
MEKKKQIIGIIGYGNMGSAIAQRIKQAFEVFIFDKDTGKVKSAAGLTIAKNIKELIQNAGIIILAVKPQDFDTVLTDIKHDAADTLIISIAAGIPTQYMEKKLGNVRVIRVMPNLPAKIGKGVTFICKGKFATEDDLHFAKELFNHVGRTLALRENMMDAATAVAGSGPGFLYDRLSDKKAAEWERYAFDVFMPECEASALDRGFSPQQAELIAKWVTEGSLDLLKISKESPKVLCIQVTSKGGTTEAGLEVLRKGNGSLKDATKAAQKKAKELTRR